VALGLTMRATLRVKLALVSLLLLIIPLLGLRLNSSLKASLIASQEDALNLTATAVSTALSNRAELFVQERFHSLQPGRDLYLFQLSNAIRIDDNVITDWLPEISKAQTFGQEHLLNEDPDFDPESLSFRYIAGKQDEFLYALFDVKDDRLVYQGADLLDFDGSDHLKIVIEKNGEQHTYLLAPQKPGLVIGVLKPVNAFIDPPTENRIIGMWNETAKGYTLEVRIHADMLGDKLAFVSAPSACRRIRRSLAGCSPHPPQSKRSSTHWTVPMPAYGWWIEISGSEQRWAVCMRTRITSRQQMVFSVS
jgi:hypothetical protein